jgi:hypothetical protein
MAATATIQLPVRNQMKPSIKRVEITTQAGLCPLSITGAPGVLDWIVSRGTATGGVGCRPSLDPQGPMSLTSLLPLREKVARRAG